MNFLETTLAFIVAQIPTFFIQRYFFEKLMKKNLEKIEVKIWNKISGLWRKKE